MRYALLRAGRLWPLHLALLACWIGLECLTAYVAGRPLFHGDRSLFELFLAAFLLHGFSNDSPLAWNGPSWSISVEIWLYLLFALVWRYGGRAWLVLVGAITLSGLIIGLQGPGGLGTPVSGYLVRGLAGFGLGTLAWHLRAALPTVGLVRGWLLAELAALMTVVFVVTSSGRSNALADLAFALLVLVMADSRGPVSRLLHKRPMVLLGKLSYSIYLVHSLPIALLMGGLTVLGLVRPGILGGYQMPVMNLPGPLSDALALGVLAVTIAGASLTWRYIEFPAREWTRRKAAEAGGAKAELQAPTT